MFELTKEELENWRVQNASSNHELMGVRILPFALTEQDVAVLSSVLKAKKQSMSTSPLCEHLSPFGNSTPISMTYGKLFNKLKMR